MPLPKVLVLILAGGAGNRPSNGRLWDLDRTTGGMLTLPPRQGSDRGGWHAGTAALEGYWRDVGTVEAYWQAHREFLEGTPPLRLDYPQWPVHTRVGPDAPIGDGSEGDVTLVGRAAELAAGTVVPPGGRLPEDE
jgi:ADP-glucose pyrophosphorylase